MAVAVLVPVLLNAVLFTATAYFFHKVVSRHRYPHRMLPSRHGDAVGRGRGLEGWRVVALLQEPATV